MIVVLVCATVCAVTVPLGFALSLTCPLTERGVNVAAWLETVGALAFMWACIAWVTR